MNNPIKPTPEMLGKEIAGNELRFFNSLSGMPNPDPILRRIGHADAVYNSILADAHVKGDVRSIRGSFRSHRYRISAGDELDNRSKAARELCEHWLQYSKPNNVAQDWMEVMWQMCSSIFTGYKIHEVVWNNFDGKLLPVMVKDRPNSRFRFNHDGEAILLTRDNPNGVVVEPYQFVVSRHMPTCENPYGDAILSSCFWPWTFKTGGFKTFMQFCDKYGVPVPVGKYPNGLNDNQIDKFADALAELLNNSYILAPEGSDVQLLTPMGSISNLPQESMINLCNREMSKAINSQAMTSETQKMGSRAASQTAADRQEMVNNADRDIAAGTMAEIFKWITIFNFGNDVAPPTLEFYTESQATLERAQSYQSAADMGARPSKRALLEELNIPKAETDDDAILPTSKPKQTTDTAAAVSDAAFNGHPHDGFVFNEQSITAAKAEIDLENAAIDAFDAAFSESVIDGFAKMLDEFEAEGKTLAEFQDAMGEHFNGLNMDAIQELTYQALAVSALNGASESVIEVQNASQ